MNHRSVCTYEHNGAVQCSGNVQKVYTDRGIEETGLCNELEQKESHGKSASTELKL
jgi:hypothetical protein